MVRRGERCRRGGADNGHAFVNWCHFVNVVSSLCRDVERSDHFVVRFRLDGRFRLPSEGWVRCIDPDDFLPGSDNKPTNVRDKKLLLIELT